MSHLRVDRDDRGVVTVMLDRPEVRNAFGPGLMAELSTAFEQAAGDDGVRVLVVTGAGDAFSAGADLDWMRSMVDHDYDEQVADSYRLEALFRSLDTFPAPVVARINGHALGGALGLVAAADVAVAVRGARLGFSEARLGLAPAVISAYVLPKIGVGAARRWFLSAETFDADRAVAMGLVHEVCDRDDLDGVTDAIVDALLVGGPAAQRAIKTMIRDVAAAGSPADAAAITVPLIARLRVSEEGQEGMGAFFAKRPAAWVPTSHDRG
jgi:methylglutaconyl-CoA hydratase